MRVYEKEAKKLLDKCMKKRKKVISKYKDLLNPGGLDTDPDTKELHEVTVWFSKELAKLKKKYGK